MKKWSFLLLLILSAYFAEAQTYQYLGVEDGLSNRRVYSIQKDGMGYMWFLTHEGIDRYNGKNFNKYKLMDGNEEVNSLLNLNWLYIDHEGTIWEIGKKGRIFRYDATHDRFVLEYKLPENQFNDSPTPISYSCIDQNNIIWLCGEEMIYLYNTKNKQTTQVKNAINEPISDIEQIDATHFFIGTEVGIHYAELKNNQLQIIPCNKLDNISIQINELYFDEQARKLFIGTFQRGIFVYDMNTKTTSQPEFSLADVSISRIKPLNQDELLIATDGAGIYRMNIDNYKTVPYIVADFSSYNGMNGNSINDIYVDDEQRIWMANYPIGITIRKNRYPHYNWIKHSIGNKQSLINNQVNSIIEDSDGDLWFGTNNGISWYNSKNGQWQSFLSAFNSSPEYKNHIFISVCEVSPGIIWAGGYTSGIYLINKKNSSIEYFTPSSYTHTNIRADKYIRSIIKDSQGNVWSGGYYNLKCIRPQDRSVRLYPGINSITEIEEKNEKEIWVGSASGLYLVNKNSGKIQHIKLPTESTYIYCLYQAKNGSLYIGTSGAGLLIYDPISKLFTQYHTENCALISDNIYTILSDEDKNIILSTENGLTSFLTQPKTFQNWTKEQGLMSIHFNATAGTIRKNGDIIFGSSDGAIEFPKDMKLPKTYSSKMVFSDLKLFYQTVYPGDKNSPLTEDINKTKVLMLDYDENIFSLKVSSINYDYPSNILYSWKLEGFYDQWSKPDGEDVIRFTNLNPGKYTLKVRAISKEDHRIVLEERDMKIIIAQPFWLSFWALLIYAIILAMIATITLRIIILRKQRKVSDEKIEFFINTAHDIRTPLTLIKVPLEELREKESLSANGVTNINTALRNANALLRLTTNLINFEKADVYSSELYISEIELNTFMGDIFEVFQSYAEIKHINFTYDKNFRYLNVWFDREKMESILKNVISNALKYTPENGSVLLNVSDNNDTWSIEVKDTGIGIPASEQKKLFKLHFRGSNAINSKITGSGIGLILVWKLVHLHKGKITLSSVENQGSIIKMTFPKGNKSYKKARLATNTGVKTPIAPYDISAEVYQNAREQHDQKHQRLLIVEDNDELRNYLSQTLSNDYTIQTCSNGKDALTIIKEYKAELIISDIMMPEMRGDELCSIIKNDINTSHIPVILLTALNDDKDIMAGLQIGADEYIVKPFSIGILRASISNLLTNRTLLRKKYANVEINDDDEEEERLNCSKDIDWKFIATLKKKVEDNMDNPAFNIDVLASMLNMSRTSLYNKIRALTDQAPGEYIKTIKLKKAAKILREGTHSVTEVAEMSGFSDAKYFREVFKKEFNVSPSQYAKEGGNKE